MVTEFFWRISCTVKAIWILRYWGLYAIPRGFELANSFEWQDIVDFEYTPMEALREEFSVWDRY